MDKPLDFSMGSSKDQVNKCKVEEVQPVTSRIQEDISSNEKEHDFSNTLQKEMVLNAVNLSNHKQKNESNSENSKDETKSTYWNEQDAKQVNSLFTSGQKRSLTTRKYLDGLMNDDIQMPPLKQMPRLQCSVSERVGMASKLLNDLLQLQANQNASEKVQYENRINELKQDDELREGHNNENLNKKDWNNSIGRCSQNITEKNREQLQEATGSIVEDIDMIDEKRYKGSRSNCEELKAFVKVKSHKHASPLNECSSMLSPNDVLDQPHSQSQTSASLSASPLNLEANQHQQQQQVPASSELHRVNQESLRNYAAFRDNMLRHFAMTKMRRRQSASNCLDNEEDDDCNYVERRKKNNEAAKRSRDARRAKEDEVSIRAAFLEQENIQLKWDVTKLRAEVAKIRAYVIAEAAIDFQLQQQQAPSS